jgi:hypothetical protein
MRPTVIRGIVIRGMRSTYNKRNSNKEWDQHKSIKFNTSAFLSSTALAVFKIKGTPAHRGLLINITAWANVGVTESFGTSLSSRYP